MSDDETIPRPPERTAKLPLGESLEDTVAVEPGASPDPDVVEPVCPEDVAGSDVAAWAIDGEPVAGIDMDTHVTTCPACRSVIARLAPLSAATDALRNDDRSAPARVTDRAMRRVRAEATAVAVLRTFGGGLARVGRAVPDYLRGGAPSTGPDTQEFPSPEA